MMTRTSGSLLLILCLVGVAARAEVVQPDEPVVVAPVAPKPGPLPAGFEPAPVAPIEPAPLPVSPVKPVAPIETAATPEPARTTAPLPSELNIDEPGFKASVRVIAPPPEKNFDAPISKSPKKYTRPAVWSLPQEEGPDGQIISGGPIGPGGAAPTAGVPVEETISPALAQVIARERNGKKAHELVPQYQQVAKAEPENTEAIYRLGLALLKDGQIVEGTASLEEAMVRAPANPKYQCDYGLALLRAGQREKALIACQSAAVNAPAVARYQSALGDCFLTLGRGQEAAESYQRAMNIEPNNSDYVYNFGLAQMSLKMFKKAIEVFDEAIRLKPSNPQYFCSRGVALENTKKPREALGCYQQALRIDKNNANAHYLVARIYSDPDDPTYTSSLEAVEHAQTAVKLTKWKNAEYVMGLARALRVAHNFDEAVAMARKAIQLEARDEYRKELDALEKLQTLGSFEFTK